MVICCNTNTDSRFNPLLSFLNKALFSPPTLHHNIYNKMGVNMLEFCTPPVPGQRHEFYGNAHNNYIKLPIALPHTTIQKTVTSNNTLHSIATSGNLPLLKNILPFLPTPQKAVNEPHPTTGLTPLHFAASRGHFNIVQYLVDDYSATVDAKDREGEVN
jgi:ankyrin repeat protein